MYFQQQEDLKKLVLNIINSHKKKGFYFSQCGKTQRFWYFMLKWGKG